MRDAAIALLYLGAGMILGVAIGLAPENSFDVGMATGGIVAVIGAGIYAINQAREIRRRSQGRRCRGCGQRKPDMALTYGEDEGLCWPCLDEYLLDSRPTLAIKDNGEP